MHRYLYSALSQPDSTRLLQLLPRKDDPKNLRCKLFEHPLRNSNNLSHLYEALSYVWGSEDTPQSIVIDDQNLSITQNLYTVLLRLQNYSLSRIIWDHVPSCPIYPVVLSSHVREDTLVDASEMCGSASSTKIDALLAQLKSHEKSTKRLAPSRRNLPFKLTQNSVVFSSWISTLDLVERGLKRTDMRWVRFDGRSSPKERQASLGSFQNDSEVCVLLLTLSCGSVGCVWPVSSQSHLLIHAD